MHAVDPPKTLSQAANRLLRVLSDEQNNDLKRQSEDQLIEHQLGLELWIRNNWIRDNIHLTTSLTTFVDGHYQSTPEDDIPQLVIERAWRLLQDPD